MAITVTDESIEPIASIPDARQFRGQGHTSGAQRQPWADVRAAQMLLETNGLRYGGDSRPWNLAGIEKGGPVGDEPGDFELFRTRMEEQIRLARRTLSFPEELVDAKQ